MCVSRVDGKSDRRNTSEMQAVYNNRKSWFFLYCKRGNFRVGVIFAIFAILPYSRKFPPRENKTHMTFFKEIWVESWKLPPREKSCQHFREIFPQRK